ncbi:HAD-IA family hydrolase [Streptomyces cavourensis]|uniref:HAD family hydrolase n=1 Tax=Streptomyces cavourensis TaxID=67258 RepID=UPI002277FCEA|nr:HAD-IA family hydrolase [Streptomyces cavourensis]WAE65273.1 HAD-IA family hydrolase [Streptomyces cavourensis]
MLFDFDGPLCDVFAGHPAPGVAKELAATLIQLDTTTGEQALATDDPMQVLRLSQYAGEAVVCQIEEALTVAEVSAVRAAGFPVPGAAESLRAARASGRKVAIVSNNSGACVKEFLLLHDLSQFVDRVIGRYPNRPDLMKPSPFSLERAARELGIEVGKCTLIGDSTTDIQAAAQAGSMAIGFANKPGKEAGLAEAGARAIITTMVTVAEALLVLPASH